MVDLRPVVKTDQIEHLSNWAQENFRRISDDLDALPVFAYGVLEVTGEIEITTGISYVDVALASLVSPPVAGAAVVRAVPVTTAENRGSGYGNIVLTVYTDAHAVSTAPTIITWLAIGINRIP